MKVYYNEFDAKTAAWLRQLIADGLIPAGDVDERSICDVQADDVRGYDQCHFFAGIGGWAYALQLAGWGNRPVWTGSCPCQPFSHAGKRKGHADERHLWPSWFRLIRECRPAVVWGEQVASTEVLGTNAEAAFVDAVSRGNCAKANKLAKQLVAARQVHFQPRWFDGVCLDLEEIGYSIRADDLPAACVGAPHIRQRVWWLAHSPSRGCGVVGDAAQQGRGRHLDGGIKAGRLADAECERAGAGVKPEQGRAGQRRDRPAIDGSAGGLGYSDNAGLEGRRSHAGKHAGQCASRATGTDCRLPNAGIDLGIGGMHEQERGTERRASDWWADAEWIACADGKARRIGLRPAEMADGLSASLDGGGAQGCRTIEILTPGETGRAMLLRGLGNAIVPQVAAEFIRAYIESTEAA